MSAPAIFRSDSAFINYMTISADALIEGHRFDVECRKSANPPHELRYHRLNQFCVSIVFSGMCVEAFLYDYAAHAFSDDFVREHLDGMRFLSKCASYPKLIAGVDIDRSGAHWSALAKLNRIRNKFVHSKSIVPYSDPEAEAKRQELRRAEYIALPKTALTCHSAISLYVAELFRIHKLTGIDNPFPLWFSEFASKEYKDVQQALAPSVAQGAPSGEA